MRRLRATLSATHETKKEEEAVSKRKMDLITRQAKGLEVELAEARADAAEKSRQLVRNRNEVSSDARIVVRGGTVQHRDEERMPRCSVVSLYTTSVSVSARCS